MTYTGKIQIGDIIARKIKDGFDEKLVLEEGQYGIVIDRTMEGRPIHPVLCVVWSNSKHPTYIAESYVEVVCTNSK